jgi:exonuclease III
VKIATFNVNNVNKRLPNLLAWLKSSKPDVVCLQELKTAQTAFPEAPLRKAGYSAAWVGQKTWNGVAILARRSEIVVTRRDFLETHMTTRVAISKLQSTVCSLPASMLQTAILSQDLNLTTSWLG